MFVGSACTLFIAVSTEGLLVEDIIGTQTGPVERQQCCLVVGPLYTQAGTASITMGTGTLTCNQQVSTRLTTRKAFQHSVSTTFCYQETRI